MKCQILFSGKNKKNIINLSSAELAQGVVNVNQTLLVFCFLFLHKNYVEGTHLKLEVYSLEVPWQGKSHEYPQHMISGAIGQVLVWLPL